MDLLRQAELPLHQRPPEASRALLPTHLEGAREDRHPAPSRGAGPALPGVDRDNRRELDALLQQMREISWEAGGYLLEASTSPEADDSTAPPVRPPKPRTP